MFVWFVLVLNGVWKGWGGCSGMFVKGSCWFVVSVWRLGVMSGWLFVVICSSLVGGGGIGMLLGGWVSVCDVFVVGVFCWLVGKVRLLSRSSVRFVCKGRMVVIGDCRF